MRRRVALPLPDQSATQDVPFSYSLAAGSFADIDAGDSLVLSARLADGTALPAWLRFDAATHTFSGTPGNADVGTITVRVTATDGSSASASDDFELTVVDVNDAPTLALPLPDQSATQDVPFSYSLAAGSFADIDAGDSLVLSARLADGTALPAWLRFDAATHTFSGTPGNADVGTITVRVTATDGSSASVSDDFELTVANVNDAPTLALPLPDQSATQDVPFSYSLAAGSFADIDAGDSLVLSARLADGTALPAWLRFDAATHTFSGTPGNADVGTITVRVTAIDGSSASVSDDFELTVAMSTMRRRWRCRCRTSRRHRMCRSATAWRPAALPTSMPVIRWSSVPAWPMARRCRRGCASTRPRTPSAAPRAMPMSARSRCA